MPQWIPGLLMESLNLASLSTCLLTYRYVILCMRLLCVCAFACMRLLVRVCAYAWMMRVVYDACMRVCVCMCVCSWVQSVCALCECVACSRDVCVAWKREVLMFEKVVSATSFYFIFGDADWRLAHWYYDRVTVSFKAGTKGLYELLLFLLLLSPLPSPSSFFFLLHLCY